MHYVCILGRLLYGYKLFWCICPFVEITKTYWPQGNSEELSEGLPVKDIRNESTLQCPLPPSETNILNEIKGSPERSPFTKGDIGQEDEFEDGKTVCVYVCMYMCCVRLCVCGSCTLCAVYL